MYCNPTSALHSFADGFRPPPDLTISEWADQYGVLSAESSSEPGRWRTYSYQAAMMDAFVQPEVERVIVLKSARIGWTKIVGHVIGYHIHLDACPILVVQPTIEDAEGWSKEELNPMIADTPVLLERVGEQKSRSTGNTITKKHYPGGIAHVIGSNSPRGFRRITVKIVLFDEIDGYPATAGTEGDQIKLGEKRTETFWDRKIGMGSTPTEKGFSRIDRAWEKSDQGHYVLACPECGGEHIRLFRQPEEPVIARGEPLKVSHIQWDDGKPETAKWVCPDCGVLINHASHRRMMDHGYWLGEHWDWRKGEGFTFHEGFNGDIGFRIWAGYSYSPNSTPAKLVKEFLTVKSDPEELKTFVNTVLGESWEERGEKVSPTGLAARAEKYLAEVPADVKMLTMGCDVQQDRIELEILGWKDESRENYLIDYMVLPGDPTQDPVWDDLEEVLRATYKHESGADLRIKGALIDSGYLPKRVYEFSKRMGQHVLPSKGVTGTGRPVVESTEKRAKRLRKSRKRGIKPELIGVDEGKMVAYRQFRVAEPGPGYCHFNEGQDDEYYAQLTAEKLITTYKKGRPHREWVAQRPRNEALDCRVLNIAAFMLFAPDTLSAPKPAAEKKKRKARKQPQSSDFAPEGWAL